MSIDRRLTYNLRRRIRSGRERPESIANSMRGLLRLLPLELVEELIEKYPADQFAQELIFLHPETDATRAFEHLRQLMERYGAGMSVPMASASARSDLQLHPEARSLLLRHGEREVCVLLHLSRSARSVEEALSLIAQLAEVELLQARWALAERYGPELPDEPALLARLLSSGSEPFRLEVLRRWSEQKEKKALREGAPGRREETARVEAGRGRRARP